MTVENLNNYERTYLFYKVKQEILRFNTVFTFEPKFDKKRLQSLAILCAKLSQSPVKCNPKLKRTGFYDTHKQLRIQW